MSSVDTRIDILTAKGPVKENSYIVKLKPGTDKKEHLSYIDTRILDRAGGECKITHPSWDPKFFNGYAGIFSGAALDALRQLTSDIEYIEQDKIASTAGVITQQNAPWGLARLSQNQRVMGNSNELIFHYIYDASAGHGVDVYILDTGVNLFHDEFIGRAVWGNNLVHGSANTDVDGHGTHCAGTAVGTQFGVAKAARVVMVKVLGDNGKGTSSDFTSGIEWSTTYGHDLGRPGVISISIATTESSRSVNEAANMATSWGMHVVVAAGNNNGDASAHSPASANQVITVAASNIHDARWVDSNYGPSVDIFAPGEHVISAGIHGPSSTAVYSGTSQAAPHVAGLIAYLIGRNGNIAPAAMKARIQMMSMTNILSGIYQGTINALARNDQ